jgi:hypothetical protein
LIEGKACDAFQSNPEAAEEEARQNKPVSLVVYSKCREEPDLLRLERRHGGTLHGPQCEVSASALHFVPFCAVVPFLAQSTRCKDLERQ